MPPRVPVEERKRIIELFLESLPQRQICNLLNRSRRAVNRAIQPYRRDNGRLVDAERRRLSEAGLQNCVAAQKPRLADRQKCLRLKFARAVKDWGAEEWEKVVFSDECTFFHQVGPAATCLEAASCQSIFSSGRCIVSVWGAMTKEGLGPLVRIQGPFTAAAYCDVLQYVFLPRLKPGSYETLPFIAKGPSLGHRCCTVSIIGGSDRKFR
ncbi:hypothetical protein HPB52_013582 [Rhipicephalus sanguineus]|uniref:Transposase n=1 Tax=Rhipicephalus sanguineus TaxID=34632 RepID=A0A9D4T2F8_RHISA|nr:hypothetical protein HPB52_013582 [Rhipicephalus sanguineus]